jgi:phosphatidylglycerol:prolipoprotein diacylglycerol transferase
LFREPDAQLGFLWGGLTMGMLLCVPLMVGGIAVLSFALTRVPPLKQQGDRQQQADQPSATNG